MTTWGNLWCTYICPHEVTALSQHSDYIRKFVVYLHLFPISDNMGGIAAASLMCIEDCRSCGHVEGLKSTGAFDTLKICSWWSLKKAKIGNLYQRFSHFVITVRLAVTSTLPYPWLCHMLYPVANILIPNHHFTYSTYCYLLPWNTDKIRKKILIHRPICWKCWICFWKTFITAP